MTYKGRLRPPTTKSTLHKEPEHDTNLVTFIFIVITIIPKIIVMSEYKFFLLILSLN